MRRNESYRIRFREVLMALAIVIQAFLLFMIVWGPNFVLEKSTCESSVTK